MKTYSIIGKNAVISPDLVEAACFRVKDSGVVVFYDQFDEPVCMFNSDQWASIAVLRKGKNDANAR